MSMNFNEYQVKSSEILFGHENKTKLEKSTIWALGIAGEGGEVADILKKVLRGDTTLEEKEGDLKKEMGDVLWYLAQLSREIGIDFEDIAKANLEKLRSRKERGTSRGDGDNR